MSNTSKRIAYIDALRGLTMTLVVYQHINLFTGGEGSYDSMWGEALTAFRMPLFFFISGFIAYKTLEWTPKLYAQLLLKKAQVQLIPTIVFSLILTTVLSNTTQLFTNCYWFTLVLFEFFLLFYTISLISKQRVLLKNTLLIILTISGLACITLNIGPDWSFYEPLHLGDVFKFSQFFVLGIFARQYYPTLQKLVSNPYTNAAAIVIFAISLILLRNEYILENQILRSFIRGTIVRYSGLFMVFSLFYRHQDYFTANGKLSRTMQYIGRHTLDIYMLHYFFIGDLLSNGTIAGRIHNLDNLPLEFFAIGALALMNIALCLLLSQCIRNSKFLAKYLFGAK